MNTFKKTQEIILLTLIIVFMMGIKYTELLAAKFKKKPELVEKSSATLVLDLIQELKNNF